MSRENFLKEVKNERDFYEKYCSREKYGKFHYLIGHFITDFRYKDYWDKTIFPAIKSVVSGELKGDDWGSFEWQGRICFRKDHVMILDESIYEIGRKFPPLRDEKGEPIMNQDFEWLEDTDYIEANYSEFVKIDIDYFMMVCKIWYNEFAK